MKAFLILFGIFCSFTFQIFGQPVIYGLTKRPGNNKEIFLSTVNPDSGLVTIISPNLITQHLALTGTALDNANGLYYYLAPGTNGNDLKAVDISTGNLSFSLPFNYPTGTYFDLPQFNCNDSSLYGLKRDSHSSLVEFGKFDLNTGTMSWTTPFLTGSITDNYTFDKGGNTYYMCNSNVLTSINISSHVVNTFYINLPTGEYFYNIEFNCMDSCLYGTYMMNSSLYFAKLDLSTGSISVLSTTSFASGFAMGGGHILDDTHGVYYFNDGSHIYTFRLFDGALLNSKVLTYSMPGTFSLYYIKEVAPCKCNSNISTNVDEVIYTANVYPNPVTDILNIDVNGLDGKLSILIYDVFGKLVFENCSGINSNTNINMKSFSSGIYFINVMNDQRRYVYKIIKL